MTGMPKSKDAFSKREKEKKRKREQREKQTKMEGRRANKVTGKSLNEMLAYVDRDGNITSTPPNPETDNF